MLGLPSFVDHLFDLPSLPAVPGDRPRLLRQGPPARPADGPRASSLLGRGRARGCGSARCSEPRTAGGIVDGRTTGPAEPHAAAWLRAARRAGSPTPAGTASRGCVPAPGDPWRHPRGLGVALEPVRRGRGLATSGRDQRQGTGQVATGCACVVRSISVPGPTLMPGSGSCETTTEAGSLGPEIVPTWNPSMSICACASASRTQV